MGDCASADNWELMFRIERPGLASGVRRENPGLIDDVSVGGFVHAIPWAFVWTACGSATKECILFSSGGLQRGL